MVVGLEGGRQLIEPDHVRLLAGANALFVKQRNDPLRFVLNQIADYLVVEVLDGGPLDTLCQVLILPPCGGGESRDMAGENEVRAV